MVPQINFVFADAVTSAHTSNDCMNTLCDVLDLQVSGTFTSAEAVVEGKTDLNADYVALQCIDLNSFQAANKITAKTIYELGISGLQLIRVKVNSVSGGNITIVGRFLKEA